MCVCVVFNNSAVLYRLCRSSSLKWIKMQQFSLPLPYLHSFICWTNTDQVNLPPQTTCISREQRGCSGDQRHGPQHKTNQACVDSAGYMSQWPPYPFPPSAKTMSLITLRIFFFFFLLTSMWTLDCVDRCRKSQPSSMAFYTLAGSERVWGLKWDGVPWLVKPLITWLSKHNQGRRFVDHPPLTHACID